MESIYFDQYYIILRVTDQMAQTLNLTDNEKMKNFPTRFPMSINIHRMAGDYF